MRFLIQLLKVLRVVELMLLILLLIIEKWNQVNSSKLNQIYDNNLKINNIERVVGAALRYLIEWGFLERDQVFISTKCGYIP